MITVQGVTKAFQGKPVLQDVSLSVPKGGLSVVIGRSGCGKSTLLRLLNGLEVMDTGQIAIADLTLNPENAARVQKQLRGRVGMVFQNYNLFPHLRVIENLTLAPRVVRGEAPDAALARAEGLLEKVGLGALKERYPHQLSGGQSQRAAIARALVMQPDVMLYDEPTSALDPWLVDEVFQVMRALHNEGLTQVVVTHEMEFARNVASEVFHMDAGRIVAHGKPEPILDAFLSSRRSNAQTAAEARV